MSDSTYELIAAAEAAARALQDYALDHVLTFQDADDLSVRLRRAVDRVRNRPVLMED